MARRYDCLACADNGLVNGCALHRDFTPQLFISYTSFNDTLKDYYPLPGTRLKQYVVDTHRENDWERETCPRVDVASHDDNTELPCRNSGNVQWSYLAHDCCGFCCELHDETAERPDIAAWRAEKAARPPIESDRSRLSDEIAPDLSSRSHPLLGR